MRSTNPYLNFDGNTEEAFNYYRSVFGGQFEGVVRYKDFPDMGAPPAERDKIAHIALPLGNGAILMGTDVLKSRGQNLVAGNNFYIALEADTSEHADRVFAGLSAGGQAEMPLQRVEWAEKYGSCRDKFGINWMVSFTGSVRFTLPTGS